MALSLAAFKSILVDWVLKPALDILGRVFFRLPRTVQILIALALVSASAAGILFIRGNQRLHRAFVVSLGGSSDINTSKALEAIILSGVSLGSESGVNGNSHTERILRGKLAPHISKKLHELDQLVSGTHEEPNVDELVFKTTDTGYITTQPQDDSAYLFVPNVFVRLHDPLGHPASQEDYKNAIRGEDQVLGHDIAVSSRIARQLCSLKGEFLLDRNKAYQIVQSYFLTSRGVARICEDVTQPQFDSTTFFPNRPYFWPTIVNEKRLGKDPVVDIEPYFHVTEPYLDLGGNGVIISLCTALSQMHGAIVCMDVKTGTALEEAVERNLDDFGISFKTVDCYFDTPVRCENTSPPVVWDMFGNVYTEEAGRLQKSIQALGADRRAKVFGQLFTFGPPDRNGRVVFTVPRDVGSRKIGLYLAKLELGRANSLLWVQLGFGLLMLAFVLLGLVNYLLRVDEANEAFISVDRAMESAPCPYCRLGGDDKFVDVNQCFIEEIGYPLDELKRRTFNSLLADQESRETYKTITRQRTERRTDIEPYSVRLRTADDQELEVEIHGGFVPVSLRIMRRIPQTFGIIRIIQRSRT